MNARLIISMLAAVVVMSWLATTSASAQDKGATGVWKWSMTRGGGGAARETSATLKQDGDKLTGAISGRTSTTPIEDGSVKDGKVSFKVTREFGGNKMVMKYEGKLEGDTIKGSIESPGRDGGAAQKRDWEAKRAK